MDIKPYVEVGPTTELSVTVTKETFDSSFMAFTVVAGISLLIIVGVIMFFAYQHTRLPPPPPPLPLNSHDPTLHSNIGAAASAVAPAKIITAPDASALTTEQQCRASPHAVWSDNQCSCKDHFFGPTCSQEKHDPKYFAVGTPRTINANVMTQGHTTRKSFLKDSCSAKCSSSPDCIGFLYEKNGGSEGVCTLLTEDVIVPDGINIPFSHEQESTLYMRSSDNLHFENRVFLGVTAKSFPPRFWLVKEQKNYIQLKPNEITQLKFVPTYAKIYGSLTGIYCRHPFTAQDIDILLNRGETSQCYIHKSGSDINIPSNWLYKKVYVVYVENVRS